MSSPDSDSPRDPSEFLSVELSRQIVEACERFEAAWRTGQPVDLELFVTGLPADTRDRVLAELESLAAELRGEGLVDETPAGSDSAAMTSLARYEILRPLARGGMGQVSEALDRELDRMVALKEILPAGAKDPAYRRRFQVEAEITARLEHPGIIPVYNRGRMPDGRLFYTMRLIAGDQTGTLQQAVEAFHATPPAQGAPRDLAWRRLLRRVIDVCNTMAYVHREGVLHRDLKPSNILLGPYGETLVVDWGLARRLHQAPGITPGGPAQAGTGSNLTVGVGTVAHAAPEQLTGEGPSTSPSSDLYSLGTILYAVLTGRSPFPSQLEGNPQSLLERVRAGQFDPPRQVNPQVDPPLEAICLKAMAREPGERYPHAADLAADLEHWLAGEPVAVWPEPWTRRLRRWTTRHRTLVSLGMLGLVLLTAGMGILSLIQDRNRRALAEQVIVRDAALEESQAAREVSEHDRERATRSQAQAEAERSRAVAREALALQAIDEFRQAIVNHAELVKTPQLKELRGELLQKPLAFYRELRAELLALPQPSLDNLKRLRDTTSRLALLHTDIGNLAEAIQLHEQVLELSTQALAHPEAQEPEQRRFWKKARVGAHLMIGTTLARTDNKPREFQAYEQAWQEAEPLSEEDPEDRPLNVMRASVLSGMAGTLRALNRFDEAKERFSQAAQLHRLNVEQNPDQPEIRRNLARSQVNFASLLELLREPAAAAEAQREADAIFEALGDNVASDPQYLHRQASAHFNRGIDLARRGQPEQALRAYREAEQKWRRLASEFPDNNEYANALRPVLMNVATLLQRLRQIPECLTVLQELGDRLHSAIEQNPEVRELRGQLVETLHMRGHLLVPLGRDDEARTAYAGALVEAEGLCVLQPADRRWPRQVVELSLHLANLDLQSGNLPEARERLGAIRPTALSLVDSDGVEAVDRMMLRSVLGTLAEIEEFQGEPALAQDNRALALTWDQRDPAMESLDQRLREVQAGAPPRSTDESLGLARRAAVRQEYGTALALCVAALESDPTLVKDRQREAGYMAAALALWQSVHLPEDQPAQRAELRQRALGWLQQELEHWRSAGPEWRVVRRAALTRWRFDPSLAVVSRPERLAQIPAEEQPAWRDLFAEAARLADDNSPAP